MRLFIAEKPSLGRAIAQPIGIKSPIPTVSDTLAIIPKKWGLIVKEETKDQTGTYL